MRIRRVRADDWQSQREVRSRALADAPFAFMTTYAEAAALPDRSWQERTAEAAESDTHAMFVVDSGERFQGMAGAIIEGTPTRAELISVWVEPGLRGAGAGERLVRSAAGWVFGLGHPQLYLWVTTGNIPAIGLYERLGFTFTGSEQPIPGRESDTEREMVAAVTKLLNQ